MKTRESGMPEESVWTEFFSPRDILQKLGLTPSCRSVVDMGCGYGTFCIPAAEMISGKVYAYDIEQEMVIQTQKQATVVRNLSVVQHDFLEHGLPHEEHSIEYVMLFNLLHAVEATELLREARRVLETDGMLAVMHWNYDPKTPRGPSMQIRMSPDQTQELVRCVGFKVSEIINLPPYHYGFTAVVQ
jgi:ubiquinone/menaquinone biosynthesis C-methylase UbiE